MGSHQYPPLEKMLKKDAKIMIKKTDTDKTKPATADDLAASTAKIRASTAETPKDVKKEDRSADSTSSSTIEKAAKLTPEKKNRRKRSDEKSTLC
jgi:hypothetical protein